MNQEQITKLIDRFTAAETTLTEEQTLYSYFRQTHIPAELEPYREMFCGYQALQLNSAEEPVQACKARTLPLRLRIAVGIAASVLLIVGTFSLYRIHEEHQLANLYEGSYMIVNGKRIDNLSSIKKHIEQTLATADMIEKKVAEKNEVKKAERDVLESVDNPEEREKIMQILND